MGSSALIILAAGASRRLGRPKQLELIHGRSLLERTVDAGIQSNFDHVVVVLGYEAVHISQHLDGHSISTCINENWQKGMSSSIAAGMGFSIQKWDPQMIGICVSDQPFVDAVLLNELLRHSPSASRYENGMLGVPAVFNRSMFDILSSLDGDKGARSVIREREGEFNRVDFPKGTVDIDTDRDLDNLDL